MTTRKKRRPDYRMIRDTTTYSIQELAEASSRSKETIYEWIRQGLPTIDNRNPTLMYGWAVRKWLHSKWDARRTCCPDGMMHCMGCKSSRQPAAGSIEESVTGTGSVVLKARCSVCGSKMNLFVKAEEVGRFRSALTPQKQEVEGLTVSDTCSNNLGDSASTTGLQQNAANDRQSEGAPSRTGILPAGWPRNAVNERRKRNFYENRRNATNRSEKSIRKDELAINRLETFLQYRDFRLLSKAEVLAFKAQLKSEYHGATVNFTLREAQNFLKWLALRMDRKLTTEQLEAIEYLNLTAKERRSFRARPARPSPTLAEILEVLGSLPSDSLLEKRDRALLALLAGTGIRIAALVSLKLKHLEPGRRIIRQFSREVDTKFSKDLITVFFPLDEKLEQAFWSYVQDLRRVHGFTDADPVFPATQPSSGKSATFGGRVVSRSHWNSPLMAQLLTKKMFSARGYPPYTPHSMRNMISCHRETLDLSDAQYRAWEVNLGHADRGTAFQAYGQQSVDDHIRLMRQPPAGNLDVDVLAKRIAAEIKKQTENPPEPSDRTGQTRHRPMPAAPVPDEPPPTENKEDD